MKKAKKKKKETKGHLFKGDTKRKRNIINKGTNYFPSIVYSLVCK
jgi:hypothetical protein